MTYIYFIRHAEPNYNNHNDKLRELSLKGMTDRKLVTKYLSDKSVDVVLSSPCELPPLNRSVGFLVNTPTGASLPRLSRLFQPLSNTTST